ncbi:bifunctional UDP-N-acetylglucosamine diphosphorylase/glucosamine-1-phosphate N-acetyltransferase GlmU [Ignavigranum ruoffiae]|uniref:bifunctional UDP-N-acetylglucosamine diphosphorylase/glucosamine-1-phosphate N-acetyltransferase GlmU n=1 Tax=Ignavigranum ruoffiae TaxID=89093 RepID=UPI002045251C|nr:bifunctional UDP-N-acetylglucosamine diphosphorylase/glucosamine-1-phosphate N-acetyltransferase GlmU [Ignavigranum ruoffiae]UPQ86293.1 bifunctional UDP-N-acetylglucosamine diphosphorylase/glucosamine-1-phosphate N-acetyltransferase GlmU [Ignavigranum ruoffiae]
MKNRFAVILAAGKGTRMKSKIHKVLHSLHGLTMVEHVVRALKGSEMDQIVTIVGYQADKVKEVLADQTEFAFQAEQLGTGHAVQQAEDLLADQEGNTIVVSGDTPLLTAETLKAIFAYHEDSGAKATVLTASAQDPTGYGRVIRDAQGQVSRIVEQKDGNPEELAVQEINTGTYVFDNQSLFKALKQVNNHNAQGEYYLPDVIKILKDQGEKIAAYMMADMDEAIGINDRVALAEANRLMAQRINRKHMRQGVTMVNPESTYIEVDVEIGPDTVIEGNVSLKGQTVIGAEVFIGAGSEIVSSQIADQVAIRQSVIEESIVGQGSDVGPFGHLRPKSHLGEHVHIGNFVEVKKSTIGNHTKAGHLSYIGDAELGQHINVGCGTIFVNYDGKYKHKSVIGDQSFIGSGVSIVSPVQVGQRAVLAAHSSITQDVPDEALAIARSRQTNIANYWTKFINK